MKKALSLLLILMLCLSVCACGNTKDENVSETVSEEVIEKENEEIIEEVTEEESEEVTEEAETEVEEVIYVLGDIIETDLFKITPSFTGYAYELANWPDENFMTPAGKFSGQTPYGGDEEKTTIYGEILVEYVGNEKSDVTLNLNLSADYDDGFIFTGEDVDINYCVSLDGDWKYDNYMTFEPLSSSTTRIVRYCISVPEVVETTSEKPLLVTIFVNDEAYTYDFRSTEVLGSDYDPRAEFYQPVDDETKNQIVSYLKENGLAEVGWYDQTVGVFTFTFGDTSVDAVLPINGNYVYEFTGTYEVYSGSILIDWDYGEQMHLDYTFDGSTLEIITFEHDR